MRSQLFFYEKRLIYMRFRQRVVICQSASVLIGLPRAADIPPEPATISASPSPERHSPADADAFTPATLTFYVAFAYYQRSSA